MTLLRFALAACTAFALTACRGGGPGPPGARPLTILYPGDERIFGPFRDMPAKFMVFLPLARLDENGELEGVLARDWEQSADGRSWTIHLRTDVRWHDGVDFTAHDVKFTHDLWAHPEVLRESPDARTITVLDDSTFTVTYRRWTGQPVNTWNVYYPSHLLASLDPAALASWDFWTRPVGNGPYRYVRHVERTMVELEANPDFRAGTPRIDRVVLKFGQGLALPELLSGNVDALGWASTADVVQLKDEDRYRTTYEVGSATRGIMWNVRVPLFADAAVRRALTVAINRRELHALLGYPPDVPLPEGPLTERQFRRGDFGTLDHDPAEASRLLDASGWIDRDADGIRERDGLPFRFDLLVPGEVEPAAVYVQDQLARVGVAAEVVTVNLNVVRRRSRSGDFEAVLVWMDRSRDAAFFGADGSAGYRNARVDTLLSRIDRLIDPDARDSVYRELYDVFLVEQPATVLLPAVSQFVVPRWLQGLASPWRADPVVNLEHLSIGDASG